MNLPLENEEEGRERWESLEWKAGERGLVIVDRVIYLALGFITCKLAEFCRCHATGGIDLIQREFVRGAPDKYGQRKQHEEPTAWRPSSSPFMGKECRLIMID
jgi:hypothetical protein